ncbi:unnamed protein product [Cyclocybe aegerita]|uniref:Enoyl reductase (ER) domain-containing protein n=1 Tax=Cyclocybe aegerita TaxID=1973307 RepID=A0A8S0W271_CYCAE|nr:unnamed protein product [Cyclocybe aegerita]
MVVEESELLREAHALNQISDTRRGNVGLCFFPRRRNSRLYGAANCVTSCWVTKKTVGSRQGRMAPPTQLADFRNESVPYSMMTETTHSCLVSAVISSMSSTQKALAVEKKFGDFVLRDVEKYKPGAGEILIKIKAVALNPADWKIQKYGIIVEEFPVILGFDVAGDVEEVGEGVTEFAKGDRVFCQRELGGTKGGFQQFVLSPAATTAKIPPSISYDEAASIPVALSTAYIGLYNQHPHGAGLSAPLSPAEEGKYAGEPLIVLGGGSSVGQLAIQLAKLSGFSPIVTTASLKHTDFLKSLGATHVFNRNLPFNALKARVEAATSGKPIKIVYDAISIEATQEAGISLLTPGGQLILVLFPKVKAQDKKTVFTVASALRLPSNVKILETLYREKVAGFLERGVIKPNRVEVLSQGLAGIPDGLKTMEADQVSGMKLVARPQETN